MGCTIAIDCYSIQLGWRSSVYGVATGDRRTDGWSEVVEAAGRGGLLEVERLPRGVRFHVSASSTCPRLPRGVRVFHVSPLPRVILVWCQSICFGSSPPSRVSIYSPFNSTWHLIIIFYYASLITIPIRNHEIEST